jgi:hypothetical protein
MTMSDPYQPVSRTKFGQVLARWLFQICGTFARQQSMRLQFESLEHEERKPSRLKERPVKTFSGESATIS